MKIAITLHHNLDSDVVPWGGSSFLWVACARGCLDVVEFVVKDCKTVKLDVSNKRGVTPFHVACEQGSAVNIPLLQIEINCYLIAILQLMQVTSWLRSICRSCSRAPSAACGSCSRAAMATLQWTVQWRTATSILHNFSCGWGVPCRLSRRMSPMTTRPRCGWPRAKSRRPHRQCKHVLRRSCSKRSQTKVLWRSRLALLCARLLLALCAICAPSQAPFC